VPGKPTSPATLQILQRIIEIFFGLRRSQPRLRLFCFQPLDFTDVSGSLQFLVARQECLALELIHDGCEPLAFWS
jgi:hypothetical protein